MCLIVSVHCTCAVSMGIIHGHNEMHFFHIKLCKFYNILADKKNTHRKIDVNYMYITRLVKLRMIIDSNILW